MDDNGGTARHGLRRRALLTAGAAALALPMILPRRQARAAPVTIRYATGGGIGPNEMETIIHLPWLQNTVLKHYGRDYTVDMTFTRGTPEAAALLAAGQADLATLSFSAFATIVAKDLVPGGLTIISDNYQDGHPGNATNTFFVLQDAPIRSIADLRGRKVGVNAFGSAVDLDLRVMLKREKLDARRDVEIVEIAFPNMAPALRARRIDCGVLVIPFLAAEAQRRDLRPLFTGGDVFGPSSVIFQVSTNSFLKAHPTAVRAFLADYVDGLHWYYDPANRPKAIELIAGFTKSPKDVLDSYFATGHDYYRDANGCVSAAVIQKPIDAMVGENLISSGVDVARYIDTGYLPVGCPG